MSKKALLIVSFGSSYLDALQEIENIEKYLSKKYEEYDFVRAFSSRIIVKKLKKRDNKDVFLPSEALQMLKNNGYSQVLCQTLHIINGIEYEKTLDELKQFKDSFDSIRMGMPLLTSHEDYIHAVNAVMNIQSFEREKQALILMGHGTAHHSNSAYALLENMFRYKGYENVYVCTVEGMPQIDYAVKRLKSKNIKKAILMPFMIVAGDHAKNDMTGEDEDSWVNVLKSHGIESEVKLNGLGNLDDICDIFYRHCKKACEI